jgi:hypothetical protein
MNVKSTMIKMMKMLENAWSYRAAIAVMHFIDTVLEGGFKGEAKEAVHKEHAHYVN